MTSPTPILSSTATAHPRSLKSPAPRTSLSSSSRSRSPTTCPAGASASWSATRSWLPRWAASRATSTTAPSRLSRSPALPRSTARSNVSPKSLQITSLAAMSSSLASTSWAGTSPCPKPRCLSGRAFRSSTAASAHWSSRASCCSKPKPLSARASASANTATATSVSRSSKTKSAPARPCAASAPCSKPARSRLPCGHCATLPRTCHSRIAALGDSIRTAMSVPAVSSQPTEKSAHSAWLITLVLFILAIVPLWHLHVINRAMPPNKADLVAIWKGAQAAFHGQNPYLNATTVEIQRFYYGRPLRPADNVNPMAYAYPMHTVLLFAPIAWMPWTAVRLAFLILLPVFSAISVIVWYRVTEICSTSRHFALVVFISLCSWPTMWAVHQIQPSIIVALLVATGCWTLQRGKPAMAGILFALATIKPQLIAVLLAWLFLWAALRRVWSFFIAFGVTVGALLAASFRMLPGWVGYWRQASAEYAVYRHLQLDLQDVFGHAIGLVLAAALALVAVIVLWRKRRCQPHSSEFGMMCALALAVTLCILPTEMAMVY